MRTPIVVITAIILMASAGCGGEADTAAEDSSSRSAAPSVPNEVPPASPETPSETLVLTPTASPTPTPEPVPPHLATRNGAKEFFDEELDNSIDWEDAPTPKMRQRYVGIVEDTFAIVELFGSPEYLDEIAYQVVFDGTNLDSNFDRALPMIRMAQEYVSEAAAKFVGAELDSFTTHDLIPARSRTKKFGDTYVRVLGIDVINTVNVTVSKGHRPTPAK